MNDDGASGKEFSRRAALARLGLGVASVYTAPVIFNLSAARAQDASGGSGASGGASGPSGGASGPSGGDGESDGPSGDSAASGPSEPSGPSGLDDDGLDASDPSVPSGPSEPSGPSDDVGLIAPPD